MRHRGQPAKKEDLCQWVCLTLRKALSSSNIQKGFQKTGIWPLNASAVADKMGPATAFVPGMVPAIEPSDNEDYPMDSADPLFEEVVGDRIPNSQPDEEPRFYVPTESSAGSGSKLDCESGNDEEAGLMLPEE
jgi:hypothetical protein